MEVLKCSTMSSESRVSFSDTNRLNKDNVQAHKVFMCQTGTGREISECLTPACFIFIMRNRYMLMTFLISCIPSH